MIAKLEWTQRNAKQIKDKYKPLFLYMFISIITYRYYIISIVQYIPIPYLQYVLSFDVHLNIKTNR